MGCIPCNNANNNKPFSPSPGEDIPKIEIKKDNTCKKDNLTLKSNKPKEVEEDNIRRVEDIKINEGLFVNEINEDPFVKVYDKLDKINEGAFGAVFKVRHRITKVVRAMKIIKKKSLNMNEGDEKELMDEVNTLKCLDHPNIMKIYEYFNTKECFYIVSELCSGGDLFDKIQNQPLKEDQSAYVMRQLLSAVNFCHENNIIHRDLKPENIMIESEKENMKDYFIIKVIDFGTSVKMAKNKMFEEQIGTCDYIAPEVLKNNYNEKCDLWSCGVILYYMLSGKLPFHAENEGEILEKVKKGEFEFDDEVWDSISGKAKNFIKNLLNKKWEKRYSAHDALRDEWIKTNCPTNQVFIPIETIRTIVTNIRNFSATHKLQQASLAYIVHNLTKKEDTETLRKVFIKLDENSDGRLTKEEFKKGLMLVLKKDDAEKEVNRVMGIIDTDKNGFIEYEEFLRATMDKNKILTEENLKATFDLFDVNHTSKISPKELKIVLGKGLEGISDEDWKALIEEIDLKKDGEICFEEFSKMMLKE
ncbi:MAG: protein kinase [archaeon]|nr:protein kinase [archaeon]